MAFYLLIYFGSGFLNEGGQEGNVKLREDGYAFKRS